MELAVETSLVIAEVGTPWNSWAIEWCGPSRQLILLAQNSREPLDEFSDRIDRGLARVLEQKTALRQLIFVGGREHAGPVLAARARLVRTIFARLTQAHHCSRFVVDGRHGNSLADECMTALASGLATAAASGAVSLELIPSSAAA